MITNNTYDALENLLLGDANLVKIPNVSRPTDDKVTVVFTVDHFDESVKMVFSRSEYDDDLGLPVLVSKIHNVDFDEELMDDNSMKSRINYLLENMEDKLNEDYGIVQIGITKYKNSNCLEFC